MGFLQKSRNSSLTLLFRDFLISEIIFEIAFVLASN